MYLYHHLAVVTYVCVCIKCVSWCVRCFCLCACVVGRILPVTAFFVLVSPHFGVRDRTNVWNFRKVPCISWFCWSCSWAAGLLLFTPRARAAGESATDLSRRQRRSNSSAHLCAVSERKLAIFFSLEIFFLRFFTFVTPFLYPRAVELLPIMLIKTMNRSARIW